MFVAVGFHCDVISRELAQRGVRRGAAEASSSGGVQRVCASKYGRSDLDPSSKAAF